MSSSHYDVIILGCGEAGIFAAYELAHLRPALKLLAVAIGSIIYYVVIQAVVSLSGINSNYLKLLSAMIVALFLAVPYWKARYLDRPASKGGANHA